MRKHKLTEEDFERNPDLKEWGLKPGDKIGIPDPQTLTDGENEDEGEPGGGGIEVPHKPPPAP